GLYPLRKDFPHNYRPEPDYSAKPPLKEPPEGATVLPIGPFYLVLEEPAYFRLFVEGERIVGWDYRGFYNHRGIEKLGESALTYNQIPFVAERICGICGFVHACCYCQAVELAAGIEVPLRARLIRTIMLELERIHSHLLWLGLAGHIVGFDTVFMQAWRVREPVMWLCEFITGGRKHYGINVVGGVRRDIPKEKHEKILEVLDGVEAETKALKEAILGDTPLLMRLRDVGPLSKEEAWEVAVVGPTARGSKVDIDSRVDHPYAAYDVVPPEVIVYDTCDTLARTLVRVDEVLDAIRIVRECVKELGGLREGDIMAEVGEIPAGREAISVVEAPRGEDVHYVLTGPDNRPYRWKVRAPSYQNIQFSVLLLRDQTIADAPLAIASVDPCFSCTERMEVVDIRGGEVRVYTAEELAKRKRG
ncbi:MAG TPA: Fe-S-binding domain-containing protein, partial [Armatimonadetes bacterium]|nr:Fe-S-binding domain-containing protein [Armatimonadota bacterium]